MTHEITIKQEHTKTIHVPVPCYWTNGYRWTALTRDLSVITFSIYGERTEIICVHGELKNLWLGSTQESDAYRLATEEEFFEEYDKAIQSITINPILKTW